MKKRRGSAFLLESLEARLLLSADLAPMLVDGGVSKPEGESDLEFSLRPGSGGEQEADDNEQLRQEIIFVDEAVDDFDQLIADLKSQLENGRRFNVVTLDSDQDGIAQISAYLKQHQDVAAVHVISHGADGEVFLGNSRLNSTTLDGYAEAIEGWQRALSGDADLLFYGCNLAASDEGRDLVNSLTLLTWADVAASDDVTGSAKLGGDWVLEYGKGEIETAVVVNSETQQNWNGVLATFNVTTTTDGGAGSLRQAIIDANALGGANEIILGAGTYTLSLGPDGDDAAAFGDLDITSELTITGAGAGVTIIDGGGLDRVFDVHLSGNLTMSNVTVQGGNTTGSGGGIRVTGGGGGGRLNLDNVIVRNNTASNSGGGIYNDGIVTLTDVEISGNTTSGTGGGFFNTEQATLERITISGNSAADGAGIYNSNQGNLLELTNVTISGNTATANGGGIYTAELINLTNVTLASNLGGGGIYVIGGQGEVQLKNSILANNTGGNSNQLLTSQGYNIEDGNSAFTPTTGDQLNTDPLLGPLQLNGGFTQTHALLAGSLAIDPAGLSGAPSQDQRGFVRDVTPDIGAYEYNVANTAPTITSVTGAPMVDEDAVYSLDLTFTDPDDSTVTWTVNWGDGQISSAPSTGATTTLTHTYTQPGFSYNILVSANDGDVTVLQNELLVPSYATGDSIFRYEETTGAFLQEFATANGLDDPIQAIIGPDGNLYVTSEKSDHVLRYNAVTGAFIDEFVSAGSGGLNEPGGLAFGPDGNLYVSSFATDEVLRYDGASGAFIDAFVTAGSGGLNGPYGLTFGSDGNLYVNSYLDSQVLRYNGTTGAFIDEFVSSGSGGLSTPEEMIFGPDGNLYIASYDTNEVLRYNGATGAFIDAFVTAGHGGLNQTTGLAFGPDGNLYVADHQDAVILRYNGTTGVFIDEYVSAGSGGLVKPVFISFLPEQQVLVNPVNDAPTLSGGPYNLGSTDEDNASTGVQVTTILGGLTSSDSDGDTLGIAVVAASGNGTWQYSTNSTDGTDGTWTGFGSVNGSSALLLAKSSWVRYVPDGQNGENVNIDFHAWDGTSGTASIDGTPSTADPAGGGGTTAYSSGIATANLTVTAQNDAPTITSVANTAATEDSAYSYTFTVNDVDVGDTLTLSAPTLPAWLSFDPATGILSGTPTNAEVGDHAVILRVNDGTVNVDQSFTITVANTNDAPIITSVANTAATEDSAYSYTFTVNDVDVGDTLTLSVPTLPAWLSFDPATGILSGTPTNAEVGDHAVILRVNDGTVDVDQSFTITVANTNDAPIITSVANTAATEDSAYSYTFTVNDVDVGDTLTLSAPTLPAWLSFDPATGILSGTPTNAEVGDHAVVLRVNDGTVDVDQSFTITVANTNDAPTITSVANTAATEDSAYSYTFTVNDVDVGDTLTLSAPTLPAWLSFDPATGILSGTPTNAEVGDHAVILRVNDGTVDVDQSFTITVANTNDAPIITSVANTAATEDSAYSYTFTVNDVDVGDTLTLSAPTLPAWLSFDPATGILSGTPTNAEVGDHAVILRVNDGTVDVDQSFTITVANTNDAPIITSVANTAATEDSAYSYTFTVNDVDVGDTLTLSAPTLPAWLSFDPATGILSGTPTNAEVGDHAVILRVNDGTVNVDQSFTITVANTNDAPIITSVANTAATEDSAYSYTFTVNDVDVGDTLTLSAPTLPAWLSFDPATGILSGTPTNAEVGDHAVVLRVNDGTVNVDQSFTITVANTNDAGTVTIDNNTPTRGDTLTASVTDPDGATGAIAYQWYSDGIAIGGETTSTYTTTLVDVGTFITVTANYTDDLGTAESLTSAPTAAVTNINSPGTVTIDNTTPAQGDTLTASVTDPDGASGAISYQWFRGGVAIGGATGNTYTTVQADVGAVITVTADYTDDLLTVESLTSAGTVAVTNINDLGMVAIDNMTPAQGDTLTANVIDPDGASGAISYQWFSDGAAIGGATGKTYTTVQADVGTIMTVTADYSDDQSTVESLTSAGTAAVTNVNDNPAALIDNLNATEDNSMTITSVTDLLGNDADIDGDTLTLSGFTQPANGMLVDNADGTLAYTPGGDFCGIDSFTYTISDGNSGTADGTAMIVVTPVGDTPQVTNVSTTAEVQSGLIFINRNAGDGAEVSHFKISGISNGSLYLADGVTALDNGDFITVAQGQAGVRFTPAADSTADGSFHVESSEDGVSVASQSGVATSMITVLTSASPPAASEHGPPPSEPEAVTEEDVVEEEAEATDALADETDVSTNADNIFSVAKPQSTLAPNTAKPDFIPGIAAHYQANSDSDDDKTIDRSTLLSPQTLKLLLEAQNLGELKTALGKLDINTLPPDVYELVRGSLDAVKEEMGNEILLGKTVLGSAMATTVGLSAGYVVWMLKGGSLLASVLSSLPAWQLADPLAILVGKKDDDDDDDESLETIIEEGSKRDKDDKNKALELLDNLGQESEKR